MTAPHQSTSIGTSAGPGSKGASVERPNLRNPSSYILRYCNTPELPATPVTLAVNDCAINNLGRNQCLKVNETVIPVISAFEVVEFVRPFSDKSHSDPSHRAHAASKVSMKPKTNIAPPFQQLSIKQSSRSPALHCRRTQSEYRKGPMSNFTQLSSRVARELFQESGEEMGGTVEKGHKFAKAAFTKSLVTLNDNDNHNGSGFKLLKNVCRHNVVGAAANVNAESKAKPWHQVTDPIPMKYFMNGVRLIGETQDVTEPYVISPVSVSTLRPSLFSLRCRRYGMHKSLKSLLQTPERVRMPKEAATNFIQGQVDVWFAACQGDTDLVAAYIDAGVIVDALDRRHGRTPLQYAAGNNNTAIMRLLVQAGANVHSEGSRDKDSNTPLHFAALYGKTEAANYLLDNQADGNGVNLRGFKPLHLALENGHVETAELLKKYGATI
jgi:hypothetical protein